MYLTCTNTCIWQLNYTTHRVCTPDSCKRFRNECVIHVSYFFVRFIGIRQCLVTDTYVEKLSSKILVVFRNQLVSWQVVILPTMPPMMNRRRNGLVLFTLWSRLSCPDSVGSMPRLLPRLPDINLSQLFDIVCLFLVLIH